MSVVAVALVLGGLVVLLVQTRQVKLTAAAVCIVFGLVLGTTPAGGPVHEALDATGSWLWVQLESL